MARLGSMARGQADNFSDIDLLVLLTEPFNYFRELRTIVELYPIQLESEYLNRVFKEGGTLDLNVITLRDTPDIASSDQSKRL